MVLLLGIMAQIQLLNMEPLSLKHQIGLIRVYHFAAEVISLFFSGCIVLVIARVLHLDTVWLALTGIALWIILYFAIVSANHKFRGRLSERLKRKKRK